MAYCDVAPVALTTTTGIGLVLASARREVLVLASGSPAPARGIDLDNLRRGVRYRIIVPGGRAALAVAAGYRGAEVRVVSHVPVDALVVDDAVAIFPHEPRGGAAVVRLAGAVTTTAELFERIWATAPAGHPAVTRQDREVLVLLSEGCADESMADQLGISVRTVRRRVRSIMTRLGARSRFQAGVRAAHQGWVGVPPRGRAEKDAPVRATAV